MRAWEEDLGRGAIRHCKGMAVGGRTKEVMRFVGAQGFLISHAHGHVKAPAIRSESSSRCSARFSAACQSA